MGFVQEAFDKNWIAPLGFNCDNFEEEMAQYLAQAKPHLQVARKWKAFNLLYQTRV